jgi:Family of unknown function (DUF6455)
MTQDIAAIAMAVVGIFVVVAYRQYLEVHTERRMHAMIESLGLDPELASDAEIGTIMREVRQRCRNCTAEAVCERWLRGEEEGDNAFCPNQKVFEILVRNRGAI